MELGMKNLLEETYIVFDTETTGLDPKSGDQMIEIGAVKIQNGKVIDRFDELINPQRPLDPKIVEVTNITDLMLKDKPTEEEVLKHFIAWIKDDILVAHNANFDLSFLKMAYFKYHLGNLNQDCVDTLELSRYLEPYERYHNLTVLMKRYEIVWDEEKHHRADYDAEGTSLIFLEMLKRLERRNIKTLDQLKKIPKILANKRV